MSIKDLCRLCSKKEELSKDLFDSNNKNVLKLIKDLMQITISESDTLPTKVCLNCEERIVSFQLFILECYKVQDNFKKHLAQELSVKIEDETDLGQSVIKSEVKDELYADDIVLSASTNNEYESGVFQNFDDFNNDCDIQSSDDDGDDVTLAELQKEKIDNGMSGPSIDMTKYKAFLKKPYFKIKDFVKMQCNICGHKGKTFALLQKHCSDVHNEALVLDCVCGYSIKYRSTFYKHMVQHRMHNEELSNKSDDDSDIKNHLDYNNLKAKHFVKLECHLCGEKTKTWKALVDHQSLIHQSKLLVQCILCGYCIKSKLMLYKHVFEHKIEAEIQSKGKEKKAEIRADMDNCNLKVNDFVQFVCHVCNKKVSSWYTLSRHTLRIHKTQPFVRCLCGATLTSKTVMYKHVNDHKNPNSFCCDTCPKITKSAEALEKHKRKHLPKDGRKFCCSSCDKEFSTHESLKSHERSHIPIEERKIYHCDMCDLKFTTRASANSHKRVVHEKIKSYVCDLCGYACGTNGELRQHRAIHSDDKPFVCKKCYKSFKTNSNLSTHMDTHAETSYTCHVCSRVLNSRRTLRKHLLVHEERCKHICDYCNKAFKRRQTLKVHMYTHTGDKPLTCKWCDERFAYASTLRSHRMRCHPDKLPQMLPQTSYRQYQHVPPEEYIKSDLAAIGLEKDPAETI